MKYTSSFIIFLLFTTVLYSQNYLSPQWKISRKYNGSEPTNQSINTWQNVNLLLSWERQGYFWQDEKCYLINDFYLPDNLKGQELILSFSLQCNIEKVFVNGRLIAENLPNTFWYDRGKKNEYKIPYSNLKFNEKNRISIIVNSLSYTGGISHNICELHPDNYIDTKVNISFSKKAHLFKESDKLEFNISTIAFANGELNLLINNDFHEQKEKQRFKIAKGENNLKVELNPSNFEPGFYECIALQNDGSFAGTVEWFTVEPEKIKCENKAPDEFDAYWTKAINELKSIEPNYKLTKVDSLCSASRNGYVVEMQSLGNLTIRGYYFVPKSKGKFPVIMHVPGYGYGFTHHNGFKSNTNNVAELALCVRGHGISRDVFNPLDSATGIWGYKLYDKQENAYRGIYMDCVRGVDFLLNQPEIDPSRIGVSGGSQGGGLTLATAALCKENISACAFFDPFPSDIREFTNIRTLVETELNVFLNYYNNIVSFEEMLQVQDFNDTKFFANKISCPSFFAAALFDDDIPPHLGFAAYNKIKAKKQYKIYPKDSHLGESNYQKDFMEFFKNEFEY